MLAPGMLNKPLSSLMTLPIYRFICNRLTLIMKLAQLMKISDLKIKRFDASLALFMIPIIIVFAVFLMQEAGLVSK